MRKTLIWYANTLPAIFVQKKRRDFFKVESRGGDGLWYGIHIVVKKLSVKLHIL